MTCGGGVQNRSRTCTNPPLNLEGNYAQGRVMKPESAMKILVQVNKLL